MGFKAVCLAHATLTYLYYKWTVEIGYYVNWGYLTEQQRNLYMCVPVGWLAIHIIWYFIFVIGILYLTKKQRRKEKEQ